MLSNQDSNVAPQTLQDAWPVCGTKNFVSVRLYSAPQSHGAIVSVLGICPFCKQVQAGAHRSSVIATENSAIRYRASAASERSLVAE